jgi:hypothetical protein
VKFVTAPNRTYEIQQHRVSGLNLLVTAIILWNTRYLEQAIAAMRQAENIPDNLLAHLFPLGWEHVNLTGDYVWAAGQNVSANNDGLRPLRPSPELALSDRREARARLGVSPRPLGASWTQAFARNCRNQFPVV